MESYDHHKIEKKIQKFWTKKKIYKTDEKTSKEKYYILDMFPYPSGEGLHVGHPKGYIATDIVSRMKRMQGYNVLHPMGFDAFGLPAENYAIKTKTHPSVAVSKNIKRYKEQLEILGFDYDWSREINTTDPKYYKWTQWIFLQLYKKGLAYESYEPIDWCPKDKTGLAKEDIEDGRCERCGTLVEKKLLKQWILKITDYAEQLLSDIDRLDWPESIKESQKNWIGKSEGYEIDFSIKDSLEKIKVFTTRPDTILGVTYVVIAPEHRLTDLLKEKAINKEEIEKYLESVKNKSIIERTDNKKEKTGVCVSGIMARNPANNELVPIWIADYVLADYGTGAVMAVPFHDERDREFSQKYKLNIIERDFAKFDLIEKIGKRVIKYKLRDWVFARQRYWGEPIPMIHCEKCGIVPVAEKDLPVKLPNVKSYEPTGTGESPLASINKWVNVKCPICKSKAKRETNTMPQWAGSSWYYLRFMDPKNKNKFVDPKKEKYWNEVDLYVGGAEHATRHLIYARFWHKVLFDLGLVSNKEPFKKLQHVGLIMAEDGKKMSKRYGNVVNPDDIVRLYGADTLRVYEMFMGPFDQSIAWSTKNMIGSRRFVEKVWLLKDKVSKEIPKEDYVRQERIIHKAIKKVSSDIESIKHNTAISTLMISLNQLNEFNHIERGVYETYLKIFAPFAPHVTDEIWINHLKNKKSIHVEKWPKHDDKKIEDDFSKIVVQINGKTRSEIVIQKDSEEKDVLEKVKSNSELGDRIIGKKIIKVIYVKNRLINIVIE